MKNDRPGIFISIDGPDGSGKSTQVQVVAEAFKQLGYEVITTREPGGSPLAEEIRKLLLTKVMDGLTEALLFAAARQDHITTLIKPALEAGKVVITDRFHDSSFAYQYAGRRIHQTLQLEDMVVHRNNMDPDFTFFFTAPTEVLEQRLLARRGDKADRFDEEALVFKKRVMRGYQDRLREIQDFSYRDLHVVNAEGSIEEISAHLTAFILKKFPAKAKEQ